MTKVLISVLHYKGLTQTHKAVSSINESELKDIDATVICINNNQDEKISFDKDTFKNINLIMVNSPKNVGFSGGHNIAFREALAGNYEYILLLNNDAIVEKKLLQELLKVFKHDEKVGIAVPKIYFTKGHEYHKDRYKEGELGKVIWYAGGKTDWSNVASLHIGVDSVDSGQFETCEETEFATGACMLLSTKIIAKVGNFDERYFLYFEDADLNMRVRKKGFKIMFVPSAVAWHNNAGSSGSGSTLHDYYIARNRMLFGNTYAPFKTRIALFRESMKILTSGRTWQKKGIVDYYLRKFGKGSFNP